MQRVKKGFLSLVVGIIGFLLILAGFGLITLSSQLVLYSGLALFVLSLLSYFLL